MTPDDETLMAYADGTLDPIAAKRVEQALADDAALAAQVAAQRRLRERLAAGFGPIVDEPVPERLLAMVGGNVVPLRARRPAPRRWMQGAALAASLVLGVGIGRVSLAPVPIGVEGDRMVAVGPLAQALDVLPSGGTAPTRMLASFRNGAGRLCRVFHSPSAAGIACHDASHWNILTTQAPTEEQTGAYRQAGSADATVMAVAQNMMAGIPLTSKEEDTAKRGGWQ